MTTPTHDDSTHPVTGGPGAELRRAREAKGIERARISLQLHLSDSTIEALERDDYEHMPGIVFARGYVRKYARLLGLDEDALVEQFNRVRPEHVEPLHLTQSNFKEPSRTAFGPGGGGRGILPIAGLIAVLLVLGGAIALWMRGDAPTPTTASAPAENAELPDRLEPTTPPAEGPQGDEGGLPWPRDMIKRFTGSKDSGSLSLPPPPENYNAEDPRQDVTMGAGQLEPTPPAEQPAEDDFAQTEEPASQAPADTTLDNKTTSDIVLNFSAACWVDIRDSAGNKVLVGEFQPGEHRNLQGVPPFSVLIGNAPAVSLTVDGRPYDLAPHTRGRVARMKLDPTRN